MCAENFYVNLSISDDSVLYNLKMEKIKGSFSSTFFYVERAPAGALGAPGALTPWQGAQKEKKTYCFSIVSSDSPDYWGPLGPLGTLEPLGPLGSWGPNPMAFST